ncbi:hypothetical protein Peur_002971 [Populus x canadensis]
MLQSLLTNYFYLSFVLCKWDGTPLIALEQVSFSTKEKRRKVDTSNDMEHYSI